MPSLPEGRGDPVIRNGTALVVDDDVVSRMLIEHMLGLQGLDVVAADSVDAALAQLEDASIEIVICDLQMPERSGLDLLEALGDDRPAFVLLTGTSERAGIDDDRADGVDAFLTKPVSTTDLAEAVASLLDPPSSAIADAA